jgi:putative ABC transport system permease protein
MKLAAIALRNLARNRRRTFLSLLVIAAGTAGLVVTAGFIRFSFAGLADAIVRGGLGHLEVAPAAAALATGDRTRMPSLGDWQTIRRRVEEVPGVRAAGGAIRLAGVVSKGDRSSPFVGIGIEPDREHRMELEIKLRAGADLPATAPAEGDDRVVLGLGLAKSLDASPGDVVTILTVTTGGTLDAVDVTVAGLLTTGLQELDGQLVKMHLVTAQRLLGSENVSSIVVGLLDGDTVDKSRRDVAERLAGAKPALEVLDWRARAPFYGQVRALYSGIFVFLGSVIFVLVCLSTSNTLLMSVMERVREIGTLLALGTSRAQIAVLVLCEALWLGLLGALAGDALALGIGAAIRTLGIQMPPPPGAVDPIPLDLWIHPMDLLAAAGVMIVVLGIAAAVPIVRTSRLRIVEALAHV